MNHKAGYVGPYIQLPRNKSAKIRFGRHILGTKHYYGITFKEHASYWAGPFHTNFDTKENAMAHTDKILIDSGYVLINNAEQYEKLKLLI